MPTPSRRLAVVVTFVMLGLATVAVVSGGRDGEPSRADAADVGAPAAPPPATSARVPEGPSDAADWPRSAGPVAPLPDGAGRSGSGEAGADVRIPVGDPAQAIVDAAPEGATFLLETGVHRGFSVQPRTGQTFRGEPGTVLDGGGIVPSAFTAFGERDGSADAVTISGASPESRLVIRNYAGPLQVGAIHPHVDTRPQLGMGRGWTVQWADIHDNAATGIRLADDMTVRDNVIHHNGQLGIGGTGSGIIITGNEIAYNRTRNDVDPNWEGGGIKLVTTRNAVVDGNDVHNNRGTGLWSDIDAVGTVFSANTVTDNDGAGIFDEISYGAEIRDNIVSGNGIADDGWFWNAGIQVAASRDVTISGNVLTGNRGGIMLIQQRRGSGALGPHLVDGIVVRDNEVTNSGVTGAARDDTALLLYDADISFETNRYRSALDHPFYWNDDLVTLDEWREIGHDR